MFPLLSPCLLKMMSSTIHILTSICAIAGIGLDLLQTTIVMVAALD